MCVCFTHIRVGRTSWLLCGASGGLHHATVRHSKGVLPGKTLVTAAAATSPATPSPGWVYTPPARLSTRCMRTEGGTWSEGS